MEKRASFLGSVAHIGLSADTINPSHYLDSGIFDIKIFDVFVIN